jgi:hypothetical protein
MDRGELHAQQPVFCFEMITSRRQILCHGATLFP